MSSTHKLATSVVLKPGIHLIIVRLGESFQFVVNLGDNMARFILHGLSCPEAPDLTISLPHCKLMQKDFTGTN